MSSYRDRALAASCSAALIAGIAAIGQRLFFAADIRLTLAPLAGIVAALAARRLADAAACAALGVVAGAVAASLISSPAWLPVGSWLPSVLVAAAIGAVIGALVAFVLARSSRFEALFGLLAVVIVVGCMWTAVLQRAQTPLDSGFTLTQLVAPADLSVKLTTDESMYAVYIADVANGKPYYASVREVLDRANRERSGELVDAHSPLSYRLPTLFVALSLLRGNGGAMVIAALVWATLAVVSAYRLCRRFVDAPLALLGVTVLATYLVGYLGGVQLLDTELWAGILGVSFVAAFVAAERSHGATRAAFVVASVAAALLAALIRELAFAFLLVGLAASLAGTSPGRLRRVLPWVPAAIAALGVYALHWRAASIAIRSATSAALAEPASWLRPFGVPLASAAWFAATFMRVAPFVPVALIALGLIGSVRAGRGVGERVVLALTAVGGAVACLFVGPSGPAILGTFSPPYWATIVMPAILACVPLAFVSARRDSDSS